MHRSRPLLVLVYSRRTVECGRNNRVFLCTPVIRFSSSDRIAGTRPACSLKKNERPVRIWPVPWSGTELDQIIADYELSAMRSEWLVQFMRAFSTGAVLHCRNKSHFVAVPIRTTTADLLK